VANRPLQAYPRILTSVGETFADGSVLELVTSATPGRLALLFRRAGQKQVAAQIEHSGCLYRPPNLVEEMIRAMRIPHDAKPYGSIGKLLHRIREIFELHAGLPQPQSALLTAWTASSWFADCISSPPTLLVSGLDMGCAVRLFRLLHCVCRRPVLLGDLSRSAFLALAPLGATLLINQPDLSPSVRALWSTSNYRGVHVFGNGRLKSVAGSKAIFAGMAHERQDEGLRLALPPTKHDMHPLDESHLAAIAQEMQPKLLDFRLRNLDKVRTNSTRDHGSNYPGTEVARNLAASVLGEPEIMESIAPLLRVLEQDNIAQRGCNVHVAMIEVAWAPSHTDREVSVSRLTDLTNALLRSRGEIFEYSAAELGWKLRNFGFRHHRNGRGMVLQFSQENRLLLHQLAPRLGLNLPSISACGLCCPTKTVDCR